MLNILRTGKCQVINNYNIRIFLESNLNALYENPLLYISSYSLAFDSICTIKLLQSRKKIQLRIYNIGLLTKLLLGLDIPFSEIKSNMINNFLSIKGFSINKQKRNSASNRPN